MARRSDPGFKVIVALTDKFTGPIKGVNQQIAQSTAKLRGMMAVPGAMMREAGLGRVGAAFGNIGTQFGKLRSSITGLLGPFARIGALIGGISLGKFVSDAITAGGELVKLSKTTGVSVEGLQRLEYAAVQSGLGAGELGGALSKLNKTIAAGRKGNKETVQVFTALGITAQELKTLNTEQIFLRAATAISNMSDPIHQAESAMKLFGKSGAELLALLSEGAGTIAELGRELEETGAVMDLQTALAAKEFGDIMTVVTHQVKGLAYSVLKELLPSMSGSATGMKEWIKANKEWITNSVVGVIRDLVEMGTAFAAIVRDDIIPAIKRLRPIWDGVVGVLGEGNTLLLAFTAVVAPGVIGAILGIGKAFIGLGIALAANPIAAAVIALAALVGFAAYQIYKDWTNITRQTEQTGDALARTLSETKANIEGLRWSDITDKFAEAWSDAVTATRATGTRLVQTFSEVWTDIKASWTAIDWGQLMRDAGAAISTGFGAVADAVIGAVTAPIASIMAAWEKLVGWLTGIWNFWSGRSATMAAAGEGPATAAQLYGGGSTGIERSAAQIYGGSAAGTERSAASMYGGVAEGPAALGAAAQTTSKSEVTVSFENMPEGARVRETNSTGNTDVNLNTTYAGRRGALAEAY